jgi:hypothetical protein
MVTCSALFPRRLAALVHLLASCTLNSCKTKIIEPNLSGEEFF